MKAVTQINSFSDVSSIAVKIKDPRNKSDMLLDELTAENAENITRTVIDLALKGDLAAATIIVEKLCPTPTPETYVDSLYLKDVITQEDANEAMTLIMNDVANQELSLEEAQTLMELLKCKVEFIQLATQEKRTYKSTINVVA